VLAAVVWPAPQPLRNAVLARALETSIASERGLGQIECLLVSYRPLAAIS